MGFDPKPRAYCYVKVNITIVMRTTATLAAAAALLAVADVAAWAPHHRSAAGLRRPRPVTRTVIMAAADGPDDIDGMAAGEIKVR